MKFADKYELLEPVTTGAVETFIARDLGSAERVLVHIFEGGQQRPDQPTVPWALEGLRRLAPLPVGLAVEAGRYAGTAYAYVVTKIPEESALQSWIQSYHASLQATIEAPAVPQSQPDVNQVDINPETDTPTSELPTQEVQTAELIAFGAVTTAPKATPNPPSAKTSPATQPVATPTPAPKAQPGEFTRMFLAGAASADVGDSGKPPTPPPQMTAPSPRLGPGAFTQQFFAGLNEGGGKPSPLPLGKEPEPGRDPVDLYQLLEDVPKIAPQEGKEPKGASIPPGAGHGSFTDSFPSTPDASAPLSPAPLNNVVEPAEPAFNLDQPKPGEFTDFFRGPFNGEQAAHTPDLPAGVQRQKAPPPGEFTFLFGSSKDATPTPVTGDAARGGTAGFGRLLSDSDGQPQIAPAFEPVREVGTSRDMSSSLPGIAEPNWGPKENLSSNTSMPAPIAIPPLTPAPRPPDVIAPRTAEPLFSTKREAEGATRIFSQPEPPKSVRSEPDVGQGPSEYTRIIQGGNVAPSKEPSIGADSFSSTSIPGLPKVSAPPAPKVPTPPKVAAPKPPQIAAPKIPDAAKAPKSFSYWPLIIALNALFLIAVLLVLYFALKK